MKFQRLVAKVTINTDAEKKTRKPFWKKKFHWSIAVSVIALYIAYDANKTTRQLFQLSNAPVLQIDFANIRTQRASNGTVVGFQLTNSSSYPVKIISTGYNLNYTKPTEADTMEFKFKSYVGEPITLYLSKELPLPQMVSDASLVATDDKVLVLYGVVQYLNLLNNNQEMIYKFRLRLKRHPSSDTVLIPKIILNENVIERHKPVAKIPGR